MDDTENLRSPTSKTAPKESSIPSMTDCTRSCSRKIGVVFTGLLQILIIVLFYFFAKYDSHAGYTKTKDGLAEVNRFYPMFQNVNVMIFVGFGFLMTFLKRYGYSSFGGNMLLSAFSIEVAMLTRGFIHMLVHRESKFVLSMETMYTAEFSAATVLISFGALLGKTSFFQLIIMTVIEVIIAAINELVLLHYLKIADIGGSMLIHAFGAYFGLAAARVLYSPEAASSKKEGSVYHSDLFSLIGTIFLWIYWPSFNGGLATGEERYRSVLNTFLSLSACLIVTFIVSSIVDKNAKMDIVHIQNSTLAGGVAVGTTANFVLEPYGAILLGSVAGILSVFGFKYLTPFLSERMKIHDTCGVNNLHGMPGLFAGMAGAIAAAIANYDVYGDSLYTIFPARSNGTEFGRTASEQGGYQAAGIFVTLGFSIAGGILAGFLLKISVWNAPRGNNLFDDNEHWNLPEDYVLQTISTEEETLLGQ